MELEVVEDQNLKDLPDCVLHWVCLELGDISLERGSVAMNCK